MTTQATTPTEQLKLRKPRGRNGGRKPLAVPTEQLKLRLPADLVEWVRKRGGQKYIIELLRREEIDARIV